MLTFRSIVAVLSMAAAFTNAAPFTYKTTNKLPKAKQHHSFLEVPRGGGIDAETLIKTQAIASIAQGVVSTRAPKLHGFPKVELTNAALGTSEFAGTGILSYGVLIYCMFGLKTSLETSMIAMNLVWLYYELGVILNEDCFPRQAVSSISGAILFSTINVCTIYAMTQGYAKTFIKALCIFWGLAGLGLIVAPDKSAEMWRFDPSKFNMATTTNMTLTGFFLVAASAFYGAIVFFGATPLKAAGWGSIVWALFHVTGLLNGSFKELGIPVAQVVFWTAFDSIVAKSTLMSDVPTTTAP